MPTEAPPNHAASAQLALSGIPFVARACEMISALALIAMMLITVADITARTFFGFSLQMSEEYGGYCLAIITFASIPAAFSRSAFHNVDFIYNLAPERVRDAMRAIFLALTLAASGLVAWQLIEFEIFSYKSGAVSQTILATPLWIPQLAMPVGVTIFAWLVLISLLKQLRRLFSATRPSSGARS